MATQTITNTQNLRPDERFVTPEVDAAFAEIIDKEFASERTFQENIDALARLEDLSAADVGATTHKCPAGRDDHLWPMR
jgi:hypothetical protein